MVKLFGMLKNAVYSFIKYVLGQFKEADHVCFQLIKFAKANTSPSSSLPQGPILWNFCYLVAHNEKFQCWKTLSVLLISPTFLFIIIANPSICRDYVILIRIVYIYISLGLCKLHLVWNTQTKRPLIYFTCKNFMNKLL